MSETGVVAVQIYAVPDRKGLPTFEFIQYWIATQIPNDELPTLGYDEQLDEHFWNWDSGFETPERIHNALESTKLVRVIGELA